MASSKIRYITVLGRKERFIFLRITGTYNKKVWARKEGETGEYAFPFEETSLNGTPVSTKP